MPLFQQSRQPVGLPFSAGELLCSGKYSWADNPTMAPCTYRSAERSWCLTVFSARVQSPWCWQELTLARASAGEQGALAAAVATALSSPCRAVGLSPGWCRLPGTPPCSWWKAGRSGTLLRHLLTLQPRGSAPVVHDPLAALGGIIFSVSVLVASLPSFHRPCLGLGPGQMGPEGTERAREPTRGRVGCKASGRACFSIRLR